MAQVAVFIYQVKQAKARSAYQKWLKQQGEFSYELRAKGIDYIQSWKRTERKQTCKSPGLGVALKCIPMATGLSLPPLGFVWSHQTPFSHMHFKAIASFCAWNSHRIARAQDCLILARKLEHSSISLGSPERKPWGKNSRLMWDVIPGNRRVGKWNREGKKINTECVISQWLVWAIPQGNSTEGTLGSGTGHMSQRGKGARVFPGIYIPTPVSHC